MLAKCPIGTGGKLRSLTLAGLHDQGQLGVDAVGILLVLLGGSHLDGVIR